MPTKAWVVFGDSGDTLVMHRTRKGNVKLRIIQGEHVTSAVLPFEELSRAVNDATGHEEDEHAAE